MDTGRTQRAFALHKRLTVATAEALATFNTTSIGLAHRTDLHDTAADDTTIGATNADVAEQLATG